MCLRVPHHNKINIMLINAEATVEQHSTVFPLLWAILNYPYTRETLQLKDSIRTVHVEFSSYILEYVRELLLAANGFDKAKLRDILWFGTVMQLQMNWCSEGAPGLTAQPEDGAD